MKLFRRFTDLGIEGSAARRYDRDSRKHRMKEMKNYAQEVSKYLRQGNAVLEIAPGPGYLALELAKLGTFWIVGLDISKTFVDIARKNAKAAHLPVEFLQGSVSEIPFKEAMFDFVVCTAAFKNFRKPALAMKEMYRVLKPGGSVMIIDMNRDAPAGEFKKLIGDMGLKGFQAFWMKLVFLLVLRNAAYRRKDFENFISQIPASDFEIHEEGIGLKVLIRK